jgi:predicted ester cyclase
MMPELTFLRGFAKRYTAAWCSRNAASVAAFFAAIGSLSVNGDPAVGRRAITEVAQGFMSAFPDMELLMDDIRTGGTLSGTIPGGGGTAKRVRFSGFEEWKFGEDGLIAESQGHFDVADYQRQLKRGAEEAR